MQSEMGLGTLVSLEEYLNTSYEPDVDYLDGVLVGRNVGTPLHAFLQTLVAAYLLRFADSHRIRTLTECRLLVDPGTHRHRIPDVMAVAIPYTEGKVITDIPLVVVEIKSPDDTLDQIIDRCLDYSRLRVPNIIVLDPDNSRQFVFADSALSLVPEITLRLPVGDLPLPAADMFARLAQP